ncbi:hypothetical protein FACS189442_2820 [Spirochaetia bacterium]|nr:hypothetical protein FACS189442_2820 [Spirochaetia bacterium]
MGNLTNIYWPVYKNLESELIKLSYNIQIDDTQLSVYSAKTADLILRGATEIKSLAKELCRQEAIHDDKHKFDYDCLKKLNDKWKLDKKVVSIAGSTCYQTEKILVPFIKTEKSVNNKSICSWNNAYQYLKHDKVNSLSKYGTIKYLFDVFAALFILNIFYRNDVISLGGDNTGNNFPLGLGSDIFAIKIKFAPFNNTKINIDDCIYRIKYTDDYFSELTESLFGMTERYNDNCLQHPKFLQFIQAEQNENMTQTQLKDMYSGRFSVILGKEESDRVFGSAFGDKTLTEILKKKECMAVLNKGNNR